MNFVGKSEETALYELLKKFFSSAPIKSRFKFIGEKKYSGCEKWIQIELLKFLHDTENVVNDEIAKEDCYSQDQRTNDHREWQFIDLSFRLSNKQYYIALELKHKHNLALAEVENDLAKGKNIKPSQKYYFKKIYCLLIHPFQEEEYINKKVESNENFSGRMEFTFKIPTSTLACTIFSGPISK